MRSAMRIAMPVILPRAVVVWGLTRLLLAALPMAVGQDFGSIPPSPVGVILLAGIVGIIDVRVRGERILWANLGMSPGALYVLYAMAAIPAECVVAVALR